MSNLTQKLDFRQSQTLVMTPQLQQAIKLLQMGNLELAAFVESELAQNPLLEKAEGEEGAAAAEDAPPPAAETDNVADDFDNAWTGNEASPPERADFDPGSARIAGAGGNANFDDPENSFENRLTRPVTLREHLESQMQVAFEDPRDRLIGALLIDQLDESGYLRHDTQELTERLACPPARLEGLIARLKQFSPTGVFARDLAECLALQLEEKGGLDAPMRALLDHLDMIAARDYKGLAAACGVNETYLQDMIAEIRELNPRPAAEFEPLHVQTVVPDVLMKRLPNNLGGGWRVELNAETLPRVLVNNEYYAEVAGKARGKEDRKYLEEQLQSANWLVRAMDQRAKTIIKVAAEIIERQEGFFLYGIEFLRPLVLRDIAEAIDMHESTVSRVTSNKYIGTPRGIFELKYFFSTALGEGSDAVAAEAVKAKIRGMIDAEDTAKILSDDTIAEILQKDGIDIARRTVAKYREAMGIGSSVQRRREKKR
jgi:RNA polymerase sigma-54 factor